MSTVAKQLGRRVAELRQAAKLTQAELSERVGVTVETISRLERGAAMPSLERLAAIGDALGVELPDLVRLRQRPSPKDQALDRLLAVVRPRTTAEITALREIAEVIFRAWRPR